ncbi:hypothetical protein GP486_003838 [Trichoglossum hirsutum]|uniref:Ankyrin n=1 Tax=Trichoglossum hirsutum TaxID=265104 RepID=A0A9P8LCA4_9PEZI|nr:hypothetical protein GP486_003838 [Trichoglossum hirsutum]
MDPLSVSASVVTLLGATQAVLRLIRSVRGAPDELLLLGNEITDFRGVLSNIRGSAVEEQALVTTTGPFPDGQSQPATTEAEVEAWTQRAQNKLSELEALIKKATKARNTSGVGVKKRIWLKERSRLKVMREELKDIKLNLGLYFCIKSSTNTFRNTLLLKRVSVDTVQSSEAQTRQNEHQARLLEEIAQHLNYFGGQGEQRGSGGSTVDTAQIEQTRTVSSRLTISGPSSNPVQTATTTETTVSRLKMEFSRFQKKSCAGFCSCYAISYGQAAVCKLLIKYGADPMVEDGGDNLSALEWAWSMILGSVLPQRQITELQETDAGGRTALSWAAQRGDVTSVKALLRYNADPNICPSRGQSPLYYAAQAQTPDCIRPLIESGADLAQADAEGQNALHNAVRRHDDTRYIIPLLEAGMDVNCMTNYSFSPLIIASGGNFFGVARHLLDNGADVNLRGQYRKTPVFYTVEFNSHETLQLLWERGADLSMENDSGPTIVHFAARFADVRTLEILTSFGLSISNVDCLSCDGFTVPELVEQRADEATFEGVKEAFADFLRSLVIPEEDTTAEEGDEGDVFWDAPENPVELG